MTPRTYTDADIAKMLKDERSLQAIFDIAGKKVLDFMLRKHLSSCIAVEPYPKELYLKVPVTIIYRGGLERIVVNPVGTEVSVKV